MNAITKLPLKPRINVHGRSLGSLCCTLASVSFGARMSKQLAINDEREYLPSAAELVWPARVRESSATGDQLSTWPKCRALSAEPGRPQRWDAPREVHQLPRGDRELVKERYPLAQRQRRPSRQFA